MREAIDYINFHYQEDITIEDLAGACGLNRSYFGRLFKQVMGEFPPPSSFCCIIAWQKPQSFSGEPASL